MNKTTERFVTDYFNQIGIKCERSLNNIIYNFEKIAGKELAQKIKAIINQRGKNHGDSFDDVYAIKNVSYKAALTFTGNFDGDILFSVCKWIYQNKKYFGKTICEIGCDIGIISCFLAKLFPDSHITSIDKNESSIVIAKELACKLGITNVSFIVSNSRDITEKFDTVFSCRTMHENYKTVEDPYSMFKDYANNFRNALSQYAKNISQLVSNDGCFVSIERCEKNPLLLGWILSLCDESLFFETGSYNLMKCRELGEESNFSAFVAKREPTKTEENIYNSYCSLFKSDMNANSATFKGWLASLLLQNSASELIYGYDVYANNTKVMRVSLYKNVNDTDSLLYFVYNGQYELADYYYDALDELLNQMKNHKEILSKSYIVKEL